MVFSHIMRHAVMILFSFFIKDRSSLQYFITQGMGQSSIFLTFRTICNFRIEGGGAKSYDDRGL